MSDPHNVKLDRNTDALQQLALDMGRLAEAILEKSLHSVWELDAKLARPRYRRRRSPCVSA
jgi:hypothetical protein